MRLVDIFARLGLSKHACTVYESLHQSRAPLLVAQIARTSGLLRTQVYRALHELESQELVKRGVQGKRVGYRAAPPRVVEERFKGELAKTKKEIARYQKQREREVPETIRLYSGFAGIRSVFDDVVAHTPRGETFYRYTSEKDLAAVNRYLSSEYRALRDKKKLERLVISNPRSGRQKRSRLERFIKYIEPESALFEQNVIQLIYGTRVAFINLNTESAFVIEDEQLAQFQKTIFLQLYKKLR